MNCHLITIPLVFIILTLRKRNPIVVVKFSKTMMAFCMVSSLPIALFVSMDSSKSSKE